MFDADKVIELLKKRKSNFLTIAKKMGIKREDNKKFSKFLHDLIKKGVISTSPDREYYVPNILKSYTGQIRVNSRGFGFVDIEEEKSIFIAPNNINLAMDNDTVIIDIFEDPMNKGDFQGIVKEVTIRKRETFVGRVRKFGDKKGIVPFDKNINGRYRFKDPSKAVVDHEVKVKILEYGFVSTIDIVKDLGHKDDVSMDIVVAIEDANIPYEFDSKTIEEAKGVPSEVSEKEIEGREDLRKELIVTIDGDDTKDFDDAIHIKKLENGNYLLGVHIADVTHYVKEDKPLDQEAKKRGTSVYLADRVIPMLPEALSNGICSLNPNVDRLTISTEVEIDKNGNTVKQRIFPSVINSKNRLTYKEVNKYYRKDFSWENKELHKMLDSALELSKIIRNYKEDEGYIDFEIEESKIVVDDKGKTTTIVTRDRLESEMMIEDFMVRANETVAQFVEKQKLTFIYRVHDKPEIERIKNLQGVINILDLKISIPENTIPKEFSKAINQIKESRFDDFMKIMMLRTMAKAVYSPINIGHFGLASKSYTHFTSPIRRYPDLMVHRMLREYFFKNNTGLSGHFEQIMTGIAEHSSEAEQKAMDLERKVADIKKAEFYEQYKGHAFDGTIVSMMKFGFFVEFPNKVGGLVHVSSLMDDKYELKNGGYALSNGTKTFTVGDPINVTVANVYKSEGKIDLVLTEIYNRWLKKENNKKR